MTRAWYVTREQVMRRADIKISAYRSAEIDDACASASRDVDRLCQIGDEQRAGLAPWTGALTFDWPVSNNSDTFRFYLNQYGLYSISSVVSGGTDITTNVLPWPRSGPPYKAIDVDAASSDSLDFTSGTGQESLVITGVWTRAALDEKTNASWLLGSSPNSSTTAVTLNMPVEIGQVVRVGSERMIVTDKAWASSGQTGTLASSNAAESLAVSDGTAFFVGEELLLDSERVLVRDIAGNTLTVKRAVSGSTLAAHTAATIYYARSATVERGTLGTSAASHTSGAQLYVYRPPALAAQLAQAYAMDRLAQESALYARTIGSGENVRNASGRAIANLENDVMVAYGRQLRHRAV